MGKEWYWVGSKSSNSKRQGEKDTTHSTTTSTTHPSGCMSSVLQFFDFHHFQYPLHQHQSSFKPTNSVIPEDQTILKGVEAPRNSLELEEMPLSASNLLKEEEENLNIPMDIQIKISCGHTRSKLGSASNDFSSEISASPRAKTPNLVARLMGLDLLPESHSPSFSSCQGTPNLASKTNFHHHFRPRQSVQGKPAGHRNSIDVDFTGTRSLPETPRISSARRSDVDHHRLSLQINKEIVGVGEELDFSRFSHFRRRELKQEDEYRSPSHYARQIVKQVKGSVGRKVGLDITNTLRNREQARDHRDELVSPLKAKKSSTVLSKVVDQSCPGKHSTPSCSPRLSRFLESKQKPDAGTTSTSITKENIPHQPRKSSSSSSPPSQAFIQPQPIKVLSTKSKLQPVQVQEHRHDQPRPAMKCKETKAGERFSPRLKKPHQTTDIIRNKQEEQFVRASTANRGNSSDKKCKKTPLSNDLLNITVPTLLPVKKDPSPPTAKLPQQQVLNAQSSKRKLQLSSNSSQRYKQGATQMLVAQDNIDDRPNGVTATTTTEGGAEYEYITRMLRRTGIDKGTPVSCTKWFSPAHPLDPSIFHHLENMNNHNPNPTIISSSDDQPILLSGQLTHHCNRKLLFELVDEILVDILKPYIRMKPWIHFIGAHDYYYGHVLQGSELIDTLCMQIKSFPSADCRVLEDIDALIDKDFPQMKLQREMAFEEGEGVVIEIEKDILDTLIQETAIEFGTGETSAFW